MAGAASAIAAAAASTSGIVRMDMSPSPGSRFAAGYTWRPEPVPGQPAVAAIVRAMIVAFSPTAPSTDDFATSRNCPGRRSRRMERSEGGVIWLYERHAVHCPSARSRHRRRTGGERRPQHGGVRPALAGLDRTHGKINVSRSKMNRGVRKIDMIPWLHEELFSFRAAVGAPDLNAPVFPTHTGAPRTKDSPNRNMIRPVVRAANALRAERGLPLLPVAVAADTFWRTSVRLMLEAGAPLTYVQVQVGHEDTKTTQEIYARVLRRKQRVKVGKAFNELMYGARGSVPRSRRSAPKGPSC
jgi:hypothetical protein